MGGNGSGGYRKGAGRPKTEYGRSHPVKINFSEAVADYLRQEDYAEIEKLIRKSKRFKQWLAENQLPK